VIKTLSLRTPSSLARRFKRRAAVSWRVACLRASMKMGLISASCSLSLIAWRKRLLRMTVLGISRRCAYLGTPLIGTCALSQASNDNQSRPAVAASAQRRSAAAVDLDMRITPDIPALRRWRLWGGAVLVAEICWFALLRPRIAGNFGAVFTLALLPLTVVGYVYLMAAVSAYLVDRDWEFRLRQTIVIVLGLSVGCFVFALLWLAKVHFEGELR
jgi:hypothetical protein